MIVNVNPYDTGYDENAHVMRFSAVAREVQTTSNSKPAFSGNTLRRQLSTQFNAFKHAVAGPSKIKVVVPVIIPPQQRMSDVSSEEDTSDEVFMVEEELEVVEEDAEGSEDERDPLVEYLFEQLRDLRLQVSFRDHGNVVKLMTCLRCTSMRWRRPQWRLTYGRS